MKKHHFKKPRPSKSKKLLIVFTVAIFLGIASYLSIKSGTGPLSTFFANNDVNYVSDYDDPLATGLAKQANEAANHAATREARETDPKLKAKAAVDLYIADKAANMAAIVAEYEKNSDSKYLSDAQKKQAEDYLAKHPKANTTVTLDTLKDEATIELKNSGVLTETTVNQPTGKYKEDGTPETKPVTTYAVNEAVINKKVSDAGFKPSTSSSSGAASGGSCPGANSGIGGGQWSQTGEGVLDSSGKMTEKRYCVQCGGSRKDGKSGSGVWGDKKVICGDGEAKNYVTRPDETDKPQACWSGGSWYADSPTAVGEQYCVNGGWVKNYAEGKKTDCAKDNNKIYVKDSNSCQVKAQCSVGTQVYIESNNTCVDKVIPVTPTAEQAAADLQKAIADCNKTGFVFIQATKKCSEVTRLPTAPAATLTTPKSCSQVSCGSLQTKKAVTGSSMCYCENIATTIVRTPSSCPTGSNPRERAGSGGQLWDCFTDFTLGSTPQGSDVAPADLTPDQKNKLNDPTKPWADNNPILVKRESDCPDDSNIDTVYLPNVTGPTYRCKPKPSTVKTLHPNGQVGGSAGGPSLCKYDGGRYDQNGQYLCPDDNGFVKPEVNNVPDNNASLKTFGESCSITNRCGSGICSPKIHNKQGFGWYCMLETNNKDIDLPNDSLTNDATRCGDGLVAWDTGFVSTGRINSNESIFKRHPIYRCQPIPENLLN